MAKSVALLLMVIILLLCICNINGLNEEKENSYLSKRNPRKLRKLLQGGGGNDPSGQPPTTKPKTRKPTPSPAR